MRYYIRDGILYPEDPSDISKALAQIQAPAFYTRKIILNGQQKPQLTADIQESIHKPYRSYLLLDSKGTVLFRGIPREDQKQADLFFQEQRYELSMRDPRTFCLTDQKGHLRWKLTHNGIQGGWNLLTDLFLSPDIHLGLFVFTRYLDKEKESIPRQRKE